jgi:hypothetical protein
MNGPPLARMAFNVVFILFRSDTPELAPAWM